MAGISDSPLAPLEKLALMLPGFKGYKRKDLIRQDDALVRNAIKMRLVSAQDEIGIKESRIAQANPFDDRIAAYEDVQSQLRRIAEEVGGAPGGMYTYYTRYKMFEEDMMKIVEYDYRLLTLAEEVLKQARGEADPTSINSILEQLRVAFSDRQRLFAPESVR
jgi:hypothetical protein